MAVFYRTTIHLSGDATHTVVRIDDAIAKNDVFHRCTLAYNSEQALVVGLLLICLFPQIYTDAADGFVVAIEGSTEIIYILIAYRCVVSFRIFIIGIGEVFFHLVVFALAVGDEVVHTMGQPIEVVSRFDEVGACFRAFSLEIGGEIECLVLDGDADVFSQTEILTRAIAATKGGSLLGPCPLHPSAHEGDCHQKRFLHFYYCLVILVINKLCAKLLNISIPCCSLGAKNMMCLPNLHHFVTFACLNQTGRQQIIVPLYPYSSP